MVMSTIGVGMFWVFDLERNVVFILGHIRCLLEDMSVISSFIIILERGEGFYLLVENSVLI